MISRTMKEHDYYINSCTSGIVSLLEGGPAQTDTVLDLANMLCIAAADVHLPTQEKLLRLLAVKDFLDHVCNNP